MALHNAGIRASHAKANHIRAMTAEMDSVIICLCFNSSIDVVPLLTHFMKFPTAVHLLTLDEVGLTGQIRSTPNEVTDIRRQKFPLQVQGRRKGMRRTLGTDRGLQKQEEGPRVGVEMVVLFCGEILLLMGIVSSRLMAKEKGEGAEEVGWIFCRWCTCSIFPRSSCEDRAKGRPQRSAKWTRRKAELQGDQGDC